MRTKIIAGNLAVVLLVGLVSYAMVRSSLQAVLVDEVDSRIGRDYHLLERSFRLSALELVELVGSQASQPPLVDTFVTAIDETGKRGRAYDFAQRTAAWLADPARRGSAPDIVAVLDNHGRVVARNADRNRMYQQDLNGVPAVRTALRGGTATEIWTLTDEHKVLELAVAPVVSDGHVLGALLVGYDVSNGLAESEGSLLGREVAFVFGDQVYSSSLSEGAETEGLRAFIASDQQGPGLIRAALSDQHTVSSGTRVSLAGADYIAVVGPVPGAGSNAFAMMVLGNRSAQQAKASSLSVILILTVLGVLIVLAYGFLIASTFLRPLEQMEETVLQVINGRTDLRIDIESAELGGLAYRINQLLNMFTGIDERDDEGRVSAVPDQPRWTDEADGKVDDSSSPATESPDTAQLGAEPEAQYYARVYREYVAAKQAAGEDVSNIAEDKFVQRLKSNEQKEAAKQNAKMVRFQVEVRGTQVNLKPVVIR
jgi:HAMP domain-containing protein